MTATESHEVEPHEPHWISRSAFQFVSFAFFSMQGVLLYALQNEIYWLAVPLVLLLGHFMHGFLIGFHEASHGMLRKNRIVNEAEGVMIGAFSLLPFTLYRVTHQSHHVHLASERDIELWPFVHPKASRAFRCFYAFLELNAGIIFTPFVFMRAFLAKDSPVRSPRIRRRIWIEIGISISLWTTVLCSVAYFGIWKYFLWMYLAPAIIAANLQSWRKYIEHVGLTGSTINASTRNIVANTWTGRLVSWTLLHEPYHGVHHQSPGLSHAELPQKVSVIMPKAEDERPPFPSYTHAFLDLFRCLLDPRAGAQWKNIPPSGNTERKNAPAEAC